MLPSLDRSSKDHLATDWIHDRTSNLLFRGDPTLPHSLGRMKGTRVDGVGVVLRERLSERFVQRRRCRTKAATLEWKMGF
jgi:hypothetical protein